MTGEGIAFGVGVAIGVAVVVGAGVGVYYYRKNKQAAEKKTTNEDDLFDAVLEKVKKKNPDFNELINGQSYVQTLTAKDITSWFREYKGVITGKVKMIVAYPTKEALKGIGYENPDELDSKNDVIQFFFDDENNEVKKIRLINFEEIDSNLEAHLLESDGMIVIKD